MDPRKYFNGKAYDGAEFMTYDTDLVFFKRFKRLNYYSLFKLQHHLSRLDADLAENVILGIANGSDEMTNEICHVLKQYSKRTGVFFCNLNSDRFPLQDHGPPELWDAS